MGWHNQFSDLEAWQLRWLVAEQHSPTSASFVVFRSPGSLIKKAQQLGCPFGLAHQEHKAFQVTVHPETYRALVTVGREIQVAPSRLTRIILTCAARRNLWADILALQRQP
jgi:hypothetical protein